MAAPIALPDLSKLLLDTPGRTPFDPAHDVTQRVLLWHRDEHVDVHALDGEGGSDGMDRVTANMSGIDRVGHLMFLSVDLDDRTEVRIESHVDKLGERGLAPATKVNLSWQANQATVVAGDMT